jgi:hypothetical protein
MTRSYDASSASSARDDARGADGASLQRVIGVIGASSARYAQTSLTPAIFIRDSASPWVSPLGVSAVPTAGSAVLLRLSDPRMGFLMGFPDSLLQ